jgi:hypothetical protein
MSVTSIYLTIIIACLYSLFASKLNDYALDKAGLDKRCRPAFLGKDASVEDRLKHQDCAKEREQYQRDAMTIELIMGLLGMFLGFYMFQKSGGIDKIGSSGIALGGLITMMSFIFGNWGRMTDGYRLLLVAAALGSTVYGGAVMGVGQIDLLG